MLCLQIFNATSSQCESNCKKEFVPVCTSVGRFPMYSDCRLYYKCDEKMTPEIFTCQDGKIFSPSEAKCIPGNKCTPTKIVKDDSVPKYCANKYPPCMQEGIFRSPSDCSLYYTCSLDKEKSLYLQERYM